MSTMKCFKVNADGSIEEQPTRPRGQRMGVAAMIIEERRAEYGDRMFRALCWFGIALLAAEIITIISICANVALGGA